jgi:hypothetical protein
LRCLEKEPAQRFPSASALAEELRRPRDSAAPRARKLASGDMVLEDDAQASEWALVLAAPEEKGGWSTGMALRFEERYFQLARIGPPPAPGAPWTYRFAFWPEGVVFRRLVDYEKDWRERREARDRHPARRLQRWISGKREG